VGRALCGIGAGIILPLALGLAVPTRAQGVPAGHRAHGPAPIRGVVMDAGNGNLQVQTQAGSVTVQVTTRTRVLRTVAGSAADLATGEIVEVRVTPGSNAAAAIQIDPRISAGSAPYGPHKSHHLPPQYSAHPTPGKGPPPASSKPVHLGQIVAVSGNTITVRDNRGREATYSITNSTQITKIMRGAAEDLAIGQTVIVNRNSAGVALLITILSS